MLGSISYVARRVMLGYLRKLYPSLKPRLLRHLFDFVNRVVIRRAREAATKALNAAEEISAAAEGADATPPSQLFVATSFLLSSPHFNDGGKWGLKGERQCRPLIIRHTLSFR